MNPATYQHTTSDSIYALMSSLLPRLGTRINASHSVREQHARGEGLATSLLPDVVIWPKSVQEVSEIVALCNARKVPVVAFGAGTSVEGHVSAPHGGVCIDMSGMNELIEVSEADGYCVVQPGITREDLDARLKGTGLFFPVDPGANATLGGMASTRASGTTTMRYGSMADNVMAVQVVTATGSVLRFGTKARKSSAGFDLVHLMVGAEGTLGVITELTLRLHPLPQVMVAATCSFNSLHDAVDCVTQLAMSGVPFARVEFLDEQQVKACNLHSKLGLPERPTLFLEFHGTELAVKEQAELAEEVAKSLGCGDFTSASRPEERSRLWRARHMAYFAALALRPGCQSVVADVCVPISKLAAAVEAARQDIDRAGLVAPILGHVGDGNFHVLFMPMPNDAHEQAAVERVYNAMISRAHAVGGTCTGEHGIGMGKRQQLVAEYGPEVVDLMRTTKLAWDPNGILNPGKIF